MGEQDCNDPCHRAYRTLLFAQSAIGRIADDREDRLLGLDPVRFAPLVGNPFRHEAERAGGRSGTGLGQSIGEIDAEARQFQRVFRPLPRSPRAAQRMVKSVMGDGVGANEQLEAEHAACQILQGKRRHTFAGLCLLNRNPLRYPEEEGAGAGGWVEDRNPRVTQALRVEIIAKRPIKSAYDVRTTSTGV